MTSLEDALDLLPDDARERLRRFAAEFERIDSSGYSLFATKPLDEAADRQAMATARARLGEQSRRAAVRAVAAAFVDSAARGYSDRLALPDTIMLFRSLADRPEDRVRFVASLERAIVGLVLWDELEDDDLGALIGPWAQIVARALGSAE